MQSINGTIFDFCILKINITIIEIVGKYFHESILKEENY